MREWNGSDVAIWFAGFLFFIALVLGLIALVLHNNTSDAHIRQQECSKIAQISHASSWTEKDYSCDLSVNNKIVIVKVSE